MQPLQYQTDKVPLAGVQGISLSAEAYVRTSCILKVVEEVFHYYPGYL